MSLVLTGAQYLWLASSLVPTFGPCTLSCWLKTSQTTGQRVLIGMGNSSSSSSNPLLLLTINSGTAGRVGAQHRNDAGANGVATDTVNFPADTWCHCMAVFSAADLRTALLNGGSAGSNNFSAADPTTTDRTAIGALLRGAAGNHLTGKLAAVGIFSGDRTDLADELAAGHYPDEYPTGLLASLRLLSDATDTIGNTWSAVGSPTYDAVDHPTMVSTSSGLLLKRRRSAP